MWGGEKKRLRPGRRTRPAAGEARPYGGNAGLLRFSVVQQACPPRETRTEGYKADQISPFDETVLYRFTQRYRTIFGGVCGWLVFRLFLIFRNYFYESKTNIAEQLPKSEV